MAGCRSLAVSIRRSNSPLSSPRRPAVRPGPQVAAVAVQLVARVNGTWIGYYPTSLFSAGGLRDGAEKAAWYGEVVDYKDEGTTRTDMGNGHWPYEGWQRCAHMSNLRYQDSAGGGLRRYDPGSVYASHPDCYDIEGHFDNTGSWGSYFWWGGSGRRHGHEPRTTTAQARVPTPLRAPALGEEPPAHAAGPHGGGAGNRTRVRPGPFRPSTCVAALVLSRPPRFVRHYAVAAQPLCVVPPAPVTGAVGECPSRRQDPGRARPGLTAFGARSGGEGERGLLLVGSCCSQGWLTRSPWILGTLLRSGHLAVETCHPLCSYVPMVRPRPAGRHAERDWPATRRAERRAPRPSPQGAHDLTRAPVEERATPMSWPSGRPGRRRPPRGGPRPRGPPRRGPALGRSPRRASARQPRARSAPTW